MRRWQLIESSTVFQEVPTSSGRCWRQTKQTCWTIQRNSEADEETVLRVSLKTINHAVAKFGENKVFEIMKECMKPIDDFCKEPSLFPFLIAASCEKSTVGVIHLLLCRDLSWVNSCSNIFEGNAPKNKKRRMK